jgi:hypothetical protein
MSWFCRLAPGLALLLAGGGARAAGRVDYLRDVKPLLSARCYACHGALQQKSGLRADTAKSLRAGGNSGPVVIPGRATESPVIERVTAAGSRRMPPPGLGEAMSAEQVALLRAWIDQGAQGPADEKPEPDPREHWAFRTPVRPPLPAVRETGRLRNPVDVFLEARREEHGLEPQSPADRRRLLRRVYLDLVGLPPTLPEQEAFLADQSPDAYERVVDRLLASPHYGERWARHWLDIWRYSDWWGLGGEARNSHKHLWHWRDWVVESLCDDKGYDQMLREMLAADELYPDDPGRLRATGYLARPYFLFNRNTWLEEVVEHAGKGFLGLTVNCARCHDHKYDPIRQVDYYRLRAFFEPYQLRTDAVPGQPDFDKDGIPRAFDCNADAPTYRFLRGDERRPLKDRALPPGLPPLLAPGELRIVPVSLPPAAHAPGLHPWVLTDHLRLAESDILAARTAVSGARRDLSAAEKATARLAAAVVARAAAFSRAALLPSPPGEAFPGVGKALPYEQAHAAFDVARKALAAAELQPASLRARAAAERAKWDQMPDARELARRAAAAERRADLARAEEALSRAELELLRSPPPERSAAAEKRKAAREALARARKALEAPGESFTPLPGARKTPASNIETVKSREQPFPQTSTGRRSALARWLTDPRNPLTARVAVNHVWVRHFGRPLVPTVFDFGRKGTPPTHPELLDWLAVDFVEHGWSLKHLHRLLVTSDAYRMTSSAAGGAASSRTDPENRWYWRMNPVRLEAQAVRDALLCLSGELDPALGGPPVDPVAGEASRRRSLYFVHSHNDHHKLLAMFDDASVLECYRRTESIVPQQALALSNSRLSLEAATKISDRLQRRLGDVPDGEFVRAAFETVLACPPTADEQSACEEALRGWVDLLNKKGVPDARRRARSDLVHALVNHNDFITVR